MTVAVSASDAVLVTLAMALQPTVPVTDSERWGPLGGDQEEQPRHLPHDDSFDSFPRQAIPSSDICRGHAHLNVHCELRLGVSRGTYVSQTWPDVLCGVTALTALLIASGHPPSRDTLGKKDACRCQCHCHCHCHNVGLWPCHPHVESPCRKAHD